MSMQQRDGGMISQGIGRENIQTLEPNFNGGTHKVVNYLFCLMHPIIYFFQKLVEVVNALEWKSMAVKNSYWGSHQFWENEFLLVGQVNTRKCLPIHYSSKVFTPSRSWR